LENAKLTQWVAEIERLTRPERVVWCDGSQDEADRLTQEMLADGCLQILNPKTHPDCYYHRSHSSDVAGPST